MRFLTLLLLLTLRASAATYYISNSGSDAADGLSTGTAWQTIGTVSNAGRAYLTGDTFLFDKGSTWNEFINHPTNATIFDAYGSGAAPVINGGGVRDWCVGVGHAGTVTRNLVLTNGAATVYSNGAFTNTIEDCVVMTATFDCISGGNGSLTIARRCFVSGSSDDGFTLHDTSSGYVTDTTFTNCASAINNSGTAMALTVSNCVFINNINFDVGPLSVCTSLFVRCWFKGKSSGGSLTFYNGGIDPVTTFNYCLFDATAFSAGAQPEWVGATNTYLNNCTFVGSGSGRLIGNYFTYATNCIFKSWWKAAELSVEAAFTADHCMFYGNTTSNATTVTSYIPGEPLFVSSTDFNLLASSPGINTGVNIGLTIDLAGNAVGIIPEVGAYEQAVLTSAPGADGNWLMGTNVPLQYANLNGTWAYYGGSGTDSPEGGWRTYTPALSSNGYIAYITNSFTIPAGTNYFLFKARDYNGSNMFWVTVGSVSNYIGLTDNDFNKIWSAQCKIVVAYPTNVFTVQVNTHAADISESTTRAVLLGFYVTTNQYENVFAEGNTGFDYIVDYTWPTSFDGSAAVKGNLVENGGFDVGINHGWGIQAISSARDSSLYSMWDTNVFHDGAGSLHIPGDTFIAYSSSGLTTNQAVVESKTLKLSTNKLYTLSIWSKETAGQPGTIAIRNPIVPPTGLGYSNQFLAYTTIVASASWHRTHVTFNLFRYPTDDFQIEITASTNTWIDSVQLEEGTLTDYAPSRVLELGIVTGRVGHLFKSNETVTLPLHGYSTVTATYPISWEARDWRNALVGSGTTSLALSAGVRGSVNLTPNLNRNGVFRFMVWATGTTNSHEESLVVITPAISDAVTNLFVNTTAVAADYQMQSLWDSGFRMTRAMSTFSIFSWKNTEPADGTFLYYDEAVAKFTNQGIRIVATLYEEPAWSDPFPALNQNHVRDWITNLVTHYTNNVKIWEVRNEPNYGMSTENYTNFLITVSTNIRAIHPTDTIVGIGGAHDSIWTSNIFNALGNNWTNYMDVISTHMYPVAASPTEFIGNDGKAEGYRNALSEWKPRIWNTESGYPDMGAAVFNANFLLPGTALWPHLGSERFPLGMMFIPEGNVKNALITFAWGHEKIFYYEERIASFPSYFKNVYSGFDYDDSRKPKMVVLSALNAAIGQATGASKFTNGNANIYGYAHGSDTWLALWSSNSLPMTITFSDTTLKAFDVMGNAVSLAGSGVTRTLTAGRSPSYVLGAGMSVTTLSNLAVTALITNLADTTPPNISIDCAPRDRFTGNSFMFRWLAVDDCSVISMSDPLVILYSTRYDNEDWTEWTAYNTRTVAPINSSPHSFQVAAKDGAGNISTNGITFNEYLPLGQRISLRGTMRGQGKVGVR